jgi:parallel beta-helix repeat protein
VVWRSRSTRLLSGLVVVGVAAVAGAFGAAPAAAATGALWVDQTKAACSDALTRERVSPETPWCSLQRAVSAARAGDSVWVMPGRYRGTVRPTVSGSASAPIRFVANSGGVTIDAAGATVALKVVGVDWLSFHGFAIVGASGQGVFVDDSTGVMLSDSRVTGNRAQGIQVRASAFTVSNSTISDNGLAGISELVGSAGNVYRDNTISSNGKDGNPMNGDGVQLNGVAATVSGNTITGNGDPGIYEHGIYAGRSSSNYLIESNTLARNAASDIKAAGSGGTVRYNRLEDSRLGLVFSDNGEPISAYYNLIVGKFQHAVFFTSGIDGARARLWDNTIVQTGRLTALGDASAVFIVSAELADLRNNLICYTNPDNLGAALFVAGASRAVVVSNTNWLCGAERHGKNVTLNGVRTTLSGWRSSTGQDTGSFSTRPATFDRDFHVTSRNLGARLGQPLGLERDYAGARISARTPDIGAYESPS